MKGTYIDLGAGWFLHSETGPDRTSVSDSLSLNADHYFGPAAWARGCGPSSGLVLLEALPTREGDWQQTGEDEWKWVMPDGRELDVDPPSWPRRIVVRNTPYWTTLDLLSGHVVSSEHELVSLVRAIAQHLPAATLSSECSKCRFEKMKALIPQAFH